jgi:hypothetical protein
MHQLLLVGKLILDQIGCMNGYPNCLNNSEVLDFYLLN